MKNYIGGLLFFLGVGAGGATTWYFVHEKEKARADFEIEQVQRYYRNLEAERKKKEEKTKEEESTKDYISSSEDAAVANREKPNIADFKPRTSQKDDVKYANFYSSKGSDPERPYIIDAQTADEYEDYRKIGLQYFTDGFVSDEDGNVVDDLFSTCGVEFKTYFAANSDEDSVWVRNDRLKTDYEICRSLETYDEYMKKRPRPVTIK